MSRRANPYLRGGAAEAPAPQSVADFLERLERLGREVAELSEAVRVGGRQIAALQAAEAEGRAAVEKVMAKVRSNPLLARLLK